MWIERKRYIVRRKRDHAIMCGLARDLKFKSEGEIGDTAIKTYSSAKKAYNAVKSSFGYEDEEIYIEQITEVITNSNFGLFFDLKQRNGEWIETTDIEGIVQQKCSVCGKTKYGKFKTNYCSNCGARMIGEQHEN